MFGAARGGTQTTGAGEGARAMTAEIRQFICLTDNFGLLIHDPATGATACVDAPEAGPILEQLARLGWRLSHILLTHHHHDHIGDALELKEAHRAAKIVGARKDAHRIPGIDILVSDGDVVEIGALRAQVLETPGHTTGHLAYYFAEEGAVFVGDTLFSLGCGRIFEGAPAAMHASLARLAALPPETRVYCGHEYTLANARFALTVDADNPALIARTQEVETLRRAGRFTLPTTIGQEIATNPFLRANDPAVRRKLGLEAAADVDVFAQVRELKNHF
jgi:hydroxyacylglutathione hydrolase